ncbi:ATP-binding protein [Actinomyces naeslundii]|uniref:ATP-binding protein n=1 Tax=Actinomyces naeslundii TaxID=1655 RepID=UPI00094D8C0D|nr:RNA-binding domain-containing protein [Actinomyces naeslundii]OLO85480.1 AAA family ATPase [Actinomyces naeslundii]OMG12768.1 AAA family ATPase [Actinomyces naeslundii]
MIVDLNDLTEALARLALEGGDCLEIEAKTFSEYSRSALGPTLSAFANLPGGGTILLGVGEDPVSVIGVQHPHELQQALVSQARQGFSTEIAVDTHAITVEGKTVIAANVQEAPVNSKPCRWKETGSAYLRQYDGDYRMSQQEEQQLLLRHQRPRQDSIAVPGTSVDNLDNELVQRFLRAVRAGSTALSGQPDAEVLVNLNILTEEGETTRAGLYALGRYPQRQFPGLSITAAVTGTNDAVRATDRLTIAGPLPQMLTDAVDWVARTTQTRIRFGDDGHGRDVHEFPLIAVRELIANALIHRDLSEPALSKGVEIRLLHDRLIISSPGGLWGLSVDQLGTRDGKSAVNEHLYTICTFATDYEGRRVIEGLGSGIREVRSALREADMEPVRFQDTGVRFTALLPRSALLSPEDLTWLSGLEAQDLGVEQRHALVEMRHGKSWTNSSYRRHFGCDSQQARRQLQELVDRGYAEARGQRGSTSYVLASDGARPASDVKAVTIPAEISALSTNAPTVWACLEDGPRTRQQIVEATHLSPRQVMYALKHLTTAGAVLIDGRQGDTTTRYHRA